MSPGRKWRFPVLHRHHTKRGEQVKWAASWLDGAKMADITRSVRRSIVVRDILPAFKKRFLSEVTADDLRALYIRVKERGALATAVHLSDIVKQIYDYRSLSGLGAIASRWLCGINDAGKPCRISG
ncbi:phage integrase central domain-containing protein [Burkholderia stabilis]|uniref:phage integrase central domain-containing protein n=1 Tax=Burkholderia stabilis TaxID=95485 RepID=UPI003D364188